MTSVRTGIRGLVAGAVAIAALVGPTQTLVASAAAPDATGNPDILVAGGDDRYFSDDLDLDGDTMAVGGCVDTGGVCEIVVFILVRSDDGSWTRQAVLTPSGDSDEFGRSIAISGDTVVVGMKSPGPGGPDYSGSAEVFVRTGSTWSSQGLLALADARTNDDFSFDVDVDGDTVVVGAPGRQVGGGGAVYVYARTGGSWTRQAQLTTPAPGSYDSFGTGVAVDGATILAGAPGANGAGFGDAGKVEVYTRSGSSWQHRTTIIAPDAYTNDGFGAALALDGDTAAIGTDRFWKGRRERAYVFVGAGATWSAQARFLCKCDDDYFGSRIDVSGDDVVVGAWLDSYGQFGHEGSAYVYRRTGDSWSKVARLRPATYDAGERFGVGVAVDAGTLVVGTAAIEAEEDRIFVYGD